MPPLASLTLIPLAAAGILVFLPKHAERAIRFLSAGTTLVTLALSILYCLRYDAAHAGYQFQTQVPWIPAFGISYHVGIDGIGCVMILLHAILSFSAVLVSFSIKTRVKEYFIFFMLLIASIFGVFTSLDLFFFYLFYEMAVAPLYPLITIWGSKNKEYGAMKLTLYITSGAVVAFVGLLALYQAAGINSFDLPVIQAHLANSPLPETFQNWCAPLFIIGFGVIASLWPLHSWSPIGYAVAPAAVSMLHAGVLKKIGIYAIIRLVIGLLPSGALHWMPYVAALAVINVLYGAWAAMTQKDMKFIIGFASVSHMGYALLGVSALNQNALTGVVFFMFAHGIMAALCFALIGYIDHEAHTREIDELAGLAGPLPFVSACFVMAAFASSGLPGFANFVSEILVFFGSFETRPWQTFLAIFGIVITATYMLRLIRQVFFGETKAGLELLHDPKGAAGKLPFGILVVTLFVFGIFPSLLLNMIQPTVASIMGTKTTFKQIATASPSPFGRESAPTPLSVLSLLKEVGVRVEQYG